MYMYVDILVGDPTPGTAWAAAIHPSIQPASLAPTLFPLPNLLPNLPTYLDNYPNLGKVGREISKSTSLPPTNFYYHQHHHRCAWRTASDIVVLTYPNNRDETRQRDLRQSRSNRSRSRSRNLEHNKCDQQPCRDRSRRLPSFLSIISRNLDLI